MSFDLRDLSHDKPPSVHRFGVVKCWCISASGADPDAVALMCSTKEASDLANPGAATFFGGAVTGSMTTFSLTTLIGGGTFHPLHAGIGIAVAFAVFFIDRAGNVSALHEKGNAENRNTGRTLPSAGGRAVLNSNAVPIVRIVQSVALATVSAASLMLAGNASEIRAMGDEEFRHANKVIISEVTKNVDQSIAEARKELEASNREVRSLTAGLEKLRNEDFRRAIANGKRGATRAAPNAQQTFPAQQLTDALARQASSEAKVASLMKNRLDTIDQQAAKDPNAVKRQDGTASNLRRLFSLMAGSWALMALAAAVEISTLIAELACMLCRRTYFPSAYAAYEALRHYQEVSRIGKEAERALGLTDDPDSPPPSGPDLTPPPLAPEPPPQAPRRGPGRPPKDRSLNGAADAAQLFTEKV